MKIFLAALMVLYCLVFLAGNIRSGNSGWSGVWGFMTGMWLVLFAQTLK